MPLPQELSNFDVSNSEVQVWLFKKSSKPNNEIRFKGRWIDTDETLNAALKQAVVDKLGSILEVNPFGLLSSAGGGIALQVDALETHAGAITANAANPTAALKVRKLKDIQNTTFYVLKFVSGDNALYAVRKTDNSWQTKKTFGILSVFYADDRLGLDTDPGFNISREVDFFIVDDNVVIMNKHSFESVLSYKEAHEQDFQGLQSEQEFLSLFSTIDPLVAFVGVNRLHLRRACAIRQKGHYRDAAFIGRLRQRHADCGLNIAFDADGRIVPTLETCPDIIRALLDHRLSSIFSQCNYDVPDATVVL